MCIVVVPHFLSPSDANYRTPSYETVFYSIGEKRGDLHCIRIFLVKVFLKCFVQLTALLGREKPKIILTFLY